MEDLSLELQLLDGVPPWTGGPPRQFYTQDAFHSINQANTQDVFYSNNTPVLPSDYGWDYSKDLPGRRNLTSLAVPSPSFTDHYDDEQYMRAQQSSISNSIFNTDFVDSSQNKDMLELSSPSAPTSPTEEHDSTQGFGSVAAPTSPSRELSTKSSRKLSEVSSTESDKGDLISCSNCSTNNTSLWRRTHDGLPVCNACGLFMRLHGIPRPLSLKTDVVKKRKRERVAGSSTTGKSGGIRTRTSRHVTRPR